MKQHIICITAGQRTGTTALQRAIQATGAARTYGEIFQIDADNIGDVHRSFYSFVRENKIGLGDAMSAEGASAVAQRYIGWLREGAGTRHVLMDVKLNSWFALSPAWHYGHDEPFFLKQLKRHRAFFIFLWRRNLADQIISLYISRELGIWHNLTAKQVAGRVITAPIRQLERWATSMCRSESDMRGHLKGYDNKIVISYEDLYVDGVVSNDCRIALHALTGIALPGGPLRMRPNAVSKKQIVSNYDEAVAAISAAAAKYRGRK